MIRDADTQSEAEGIAQPVDRSTDIRIRKLRNNSRPRTGPIIQHRLPPGMIMRKYDLPFQEGPVTKYRHGVLGFLALLMVITYLDRVCISVAGPRMQEALHIGPAAWGWV